MIDSKVFSHLIKNIDWSACRNKLALLHHASLLGVHLDSQLIDKTKNEIEHVIQHTLTEYAFTLFKVVDDSKPSSHGWHYLAKEAFARWLLQLPYHQSLEPSDWTTFDQRLQTAYQEYGIATLSRQSLEIRLSQFKWIIKSHSFKVLDYTQINAVLTAFGSTYQLAKQVYSKWSAWIWGPVQIQPLGNFTVILFLSETVRTPNFLLNNPAFTLDKVIILRREVSHPIFSIKWEPLLLDTSLTGADLVSKLSVGIRRMALNAYKEDTKRVPHSLQSQLIQDFESNVLFHEVGHDIIFKIINHPETIAIGIGLTSIDEPIYESLFELLADMAPKYKGAWGGLYQLAVLAKTDYTKAFRSFYSYFSDVYFFDTPDRHMYGYSIMIGLVMARFIRSDASVDFQAMQSEFDTDNPRFSTGMVATLMDMFVRHMATIQTYVKNATYHIQGRDYAFSFIETHEINQAKLANSKTNVTEYGFLQPAWRNYMAYFKRFATTADSLPSILDTLGLERRRILVEITGLPFNPSTEATLQHDLLHYLAQLGLSHVARPS